MTTAETNPIDEAKLEAFVGQAVTDMGAAISGLLLHIGDRLGLYQAMAGAGPVTAAELAERTGTAERYVREWLGNQAAGGYVTYDPADGTFELPAEQAMVVANEDSPVFLAGAFETIASCYTDHDRFVDAFRTGAGVGWHQHDDRLFSGVLRLFRPGRQLGGLLVPGLRFAGQAAGEGQLGQRDRQLVRLRLAPGGPRRPAQRGAQLVGRLVERRPPGPVVTGRRPEPGGGVQAPAQVPGGGLVRLADGQPWLLAEPVSSAR